MTLCFEQFEMIILTVIVTTDGDWTLAVEIGAFIVSDFRKRSVCKCRSVK